MEIENLFNEWSIAYRAKGGKITVGAEKLFADFFRWLKSKAAEHTLAGGLALQPCPICGRVDENHWFDKKHLANTASRSRKSWVALCYKEES